MTRSARILAFPDMPHERKGLPLDFARALEIYYALAFYNDEIERKVALKYLVFNGSLSMDEAKLLARMFGLRICNWSVAYE